MDNKPLSIKQIADEYGITKAAVRHYLTDDFRAQYTEKWDRTIMIKPAGVAIIRAKLSNNPNNEQDLPDNYIEDNTKSRSKSPDNYPDNYPDKDVLYDQLKIKDKQIDDLSNQLTMLTKALNNQQALTLQANQRYEELSKRISAPVDQPTDDQSTEMDNQVDNEMDNPDKTNDSDVKRPGLFSRLFHRK